MIRPIVSALVARSRTDVEIPMDVYLTYWQVLQTKQDPRARQVLSQAHSLLQARAARISDPDLRRTFLENIAAHRQIVQAWQGSAEKLDQEER